MPDNLIITGGTSETGKVLVPKLRDLGHHLIISDRVGASFEKPFSHIPEEQRTFWPVDLSNFLESDWSGIDNVTGVILLAAAGLTPGMTEERAEAINCTSQVALVKHIWEKKAHPSGCRVVFINSLWGSNPDLELPHKDYGIVAYGKNKAEIALRELTKTQPISNTLNVVVASIVDKTFAAIMLKRAMNKEAKDPGAFDAFVLKKTPDGRLVTLEEDTDALMRAFCSEKGGQTFFVPPSAAEGKWPNQNMLAISA